MSQYFLKSSFTSTFSSPASVIKALFSKGISGSELFAAKIVGLAKQFLGGRRWRNVHQNRNNMSQYFFL